MKTSTEHYDVIIVGAGLSGIAAAVEMRKEHPNRTFRMFDQRDDLGGTWDLFRYPGIRSDSDMYTLGYAFKPWTDEKAIASGEAIMSYLRETVDEYHLQEHMSFGRRVVRAEWSSDRALWTVHMDGPHGAEAHTCSFLYLAAGYYDYDSGYMPDFPKVENYKGMLIHSQEWPRDLDCAGRKVAVIGSGATAITVVPALAETCEQVYMIQRSPTYVAIDSDVDPDAKELHRELGAEAAFRQIRLRNMQNQQIRYKAARENPEAFKEALFAEIEALVGKEVREAHFTPSYNPWDQRLCLVPNGDLFHAINDGRVTMVTGHIAEFTETGLRMESGQEVDVDVIVAATGLKLAPFGKIDLCVNGAKIDLSESYTYKGVTFNGVPNLVTAFGYLNASWTLRLELVNKYFSDVLRRMDELGAKEVMPELTEQDVASMERRPWKIGATSGYLLRHLHQFPSQGDRAPWINPQNHDETTALLAQIEDESLRFV